MRSRKIRELTDCKKTSECTPSGTHPVLASPPQLASYDAVISQLLLSFETPRMFVSVSLLHSPGLAFHYACHPLSVSIRLFCLLYSSSHLSFNVHLRTVKPYLTCPCHLQIVCNLQNTRTPPTIS